MNTNERIMSINDNTILINQIAKVLEVIANEHRLAYKAINERLFEMESTVDKINEVHQIIAKPKNKVQRRSIKAERIARIHIKLITQGKKQC